MKFILLCIIILLKILYDDFKFLIKIFIIIFILIKNQMEKNLINRKTKAKKAFNILF